MHIDLLIRKEKWGECGIFGILLFDTKQFANLGKLETAGGSLRTEVAGQKLEDITCNSTKLMEFIGLTEPKTLFELK